MIVSRQAVVMAVTCMISTANAQIEFRQDNTALPPFGGYTADSGLVITGGTSRDITVRQGGIDAAVPPFGGFVPGSGATLRWRTPGAARLAPRGAGAMAPGSFPAGAGLAGPNLGPVAASPMAAATNSPDRSQTAMLAAAARSSRNALAAETARLDQRRRRSAAALLRKGERAEAQKKFAAAGMYYRRALQYEVPEFEGQLTQHLERVKSTMRP